MAELKCKQCGKIFKVPNSRVKRTKNILCSMECLREYRKTLKIKIKCDYCGKEFEILKSEFKLTQKHYCNNKCYKNSKLLNEYIINENICELIINSPKWGIKKVLIDTEDLEKIKNYQWGVRKDEHRYYVLHSNKKNKLHLHRFIMDCPADKIIDHINRNPLDNRKCNLRICTQLENMQNLGTPKNNISGYKGVGFHKAINKFRVRITVNKKVISLGNFDDIEEAIKARKEAELKYFKIKEIEQC